MKKLIIPAFCLLHMAAIFWWTLPHSFGGMVLANADQASLEARLFKLMMLDNNRWAHAFLQSYIDVTGSQQYWDFFCATESKIPSIPVCLWFDYCVSCTGNNSV